MAFLEMEGKRMCARHGKRGSLLLLIFLFSLTCFVLPTRAATVGNIDAQYPVPQEAREEDISNPDHVIGTGTPESCTAEAFIAAVAKGGTIVFNGGSKPFTLTLDRPAKVFNNQNPDVVIDGGGLVTLSGGNKTRILYMNTADPNQVWTTDREYRTCSTLPLLTVSVPGVPIFVFLMSTIRR